VLPNKELLMILQHNVTLHYSNPITTGFSFDLDENTPELAEEIQMTLSSGNNFSAYYVKSNPLWENS
jgi:hypothetical protein